MPKSKYSKIKKLVLNVKDLKSISNIKSNNLIAMLMYEKNIAIIWIVLS